MELVARASNAPIESERTAIGVEGSKYWSGRLTNEGMTCHETLDAGYQCVCHLVDGSVVPINGTKCAGQ